jgi:predicted unusual protein kinase regulating ubiquinone biosynthesis (AarF/ABC1/UbiB family)
MQPDLRQATKEISTRIAEEIDYRHEAANIAAFSELYRGHPFIRIPEVIYEASGDRVLTMTYLDGMSWAAAQQADQDLKNTWAEVIWRFAGGSYRHANLFHADPHPGNYCFGSDGTVGFVDFGCVTVAPEGQRRRMLEMIRAVFDGRKQEVWDLMVEMGFVTSDSTLTVREAYQWGAELFHELLVAQPVTYTPETSERAINAIVDVRSPDHALRRMSIPDEFIFLSRVNLGLNAICAALGATFHARAITDELDGVGEPITPMGKQHHAWVRQRGLPYGLEHHDHP